MAEGECDYQNAAISKGLYSLVEQTKPIFIIPAVTPLTVFHIKLFAWLHSAHPTPSVPCKKTHSMTKHAHVPLNI